MKKLYFYIFLIFSSFALAQSPTCENAAAMCSGNQGPFVNTTGVPSFGSLGCLGSTPNPAWFYLQVGTSGNIDMTLFQTSNATGGGIDVDFILWGPFNSLSNICNNLAIYSPGYTGPNNVVDCSFSAAATEQVNIPGAIAGQYYMLLVTNFSNQAGTYTLNQTGGSGALSCSIVCGVTLGPDLPFCGSTTSTTLTANFLQAPTAAGSPVYSWFFNGVFQYTTTTNTTVVNQSGTWSVEVTRPGCSDVATDDVEVQFSVAVPSNPVGPLVGPPGECNPVFNLNDVLAAIVAPYDPASFTFVVVDENFDPITDLANFSPTVTTFIGVEPTLGTCGGDFQVINVIVDCVVPTCQLDLTSATETTNQTICLGETITDITYTFGGDATNVTVVDLPAGVTTTIASGILTISGTPSTTGSFTYTVSSVGCSPELTLQGTITIADAPTFTNLSAVSPICEGEDAVFTLVGSAGATVEYTINGGAIQTETLNAAGEVIITIPAVTANTTIEVSEIAIGSCIVALNETATVVVNPIPAVPTIDVTAPTCVLAGFATITNYDATLTYTFTPAGPTITAAGLVENVVFGTSYVVNADNGDCTSADSTPFTVEDILAVPDIPTIAITAPTCLAAGFATITNYVAGMTYDFTPAGPTVDGTGLISGMTFGTSYEVAANNGSCSSVNTAPFSIEDILVTPAVPTVATTAPTCTADGFTEITNYDATLTYTFTPAGPTITAAGLVENVVFGTSYVVNADNGDCTSADSTPFTVEDILAVPDIPTIAIIAPTCLAAGFATITNYVAGMTYDFTPAGPTVDGTGLISGMTFGTSYEVAANNGSCSSVNTAPFSIEDILVTPAVPTVATTAPTCTADGFTEITNYDATLTYTFTPAGPTITAAGLIENMVVGTSYTVTAENTTCTSADSAAFSNAAQLVTPDIPTIAITAPTCLVAGFATITNYVAGMTYDFTPAGPTVDGTGLISGMTFGTSYEVAANNGSCSSINTAPFSIEDILVTPAVPTVATTAPTCTADGFTEITNYDATLTYTFTPAGPTITAAGLIENMVVGTSYTVTAENTTCTSADSAAFSNAAQLVTPDIPTITITAPTCLAAGFATITNYIAGMTYDFTPAGPTVDGTGLISGMTFGTSYEVAANNGSCSSVNTAPFSIEDILVTPAVPTVATTAPTCTADGFTEITNYDATLTYTFTPAGPTITAAGLIENMVVGTSYTVTAENTTCTSADSAAFSNAAQLVTPDIPTITITAPTCLAAGFATITNYVAGMTYDFTPVGPTVDGTGLISGMTFGTSYEVAANNGSCSSINTAPFSIEDILVTPAVPTVATTAPTCTADGFTEITNYDATLTYTFTPAGPTITAAGLIENMVVGTSYTVTAGNTTCTSADSAAFSNAAQLITPAVPTITITAPTCSSNGVSTITNYNGTLTYTFTPTGPTVGAGGLISGMTVGTYLIQEGNRNAGNATCTSLASTLFSNAAQLPAPVVTSVTNNGPICEGGNIVFTIIGTPNAVVSYSGVVGVPASTVTLNASGQATVTVAGATSNQTITLNTVTNSITGCSATISNTSTATVLPLPTANLSSANPATCSGGSVVLNFTGTPNAIVSFTDGTNNYNVTLDGTGVNNYTTPPISSTTTFTLTSVATTATPSCSQLVGDSVTVVITPRPIMTASPNPLVLCNGATMNLVLNSDVAGTTYTWSASTTNIEGSFVLDGDGTDINQLVQLQDPTVVGFVTIVVIPRANNCDGDAVTIQVVVNPVPEITDVNVSAETICSNNEVSISVVGIPSGLSYTWQAINNNGVTIVGGVTSGTSATGDIDVTLVTTNPLVAGTIQFEITPIRNGCTGVSVVTPVITVNPIPGTPIGLPISEICSGENANLNISVTPLMTGTELDWEVVEAVNITAGYATQGSGVSPILINDILINDTDQQGFIRYRVTSRLNGCIGNTTDFIVRVNPLPRPTLQDGAICVDGSGVTFQTYVLQSGISGAMYDFDWYYNDTLIAGATGNTYTTTQPGTYSLIVTNTITGCISEEVFANVIEVQPATAASASVTDAFSDNATITVSVTGGTGTLLYQLDDEGFQESNVFTGVSAGLHTVTVIDTQGCTYLTIEVLVIDYPPFFTPNGDGFNDTWNIIGLQDQPEARIYIFDRYGKLLKQISPQGQGWDGRFNGAELPSTDYWFTVEYLENAQQKTFKAHFSMIR
jgi:gliding motility-associated-like protein